MIAPIVGAAIVIIVGMSIARRRGVAVSKAG
jgi:hypothetical protein